MESTYRRRRQKLLEKLPQGAIAIISGARKVKRSADQMYPFWQLGDFYYLAGWDEPGAVLVMIKDHKSAISIIFHKGECAISEKWSGANISHKEACQDYGFEQALSIQALDKWIEKHLDRNSAVFLLADDELQGSLGKRSLKKLDTSVLTLELMQLRLRKDPSEIERIEEACKITAMAHIKTMSVNGKRAYLNESEIAATFHYHCMTGGGQGLAYESIAASGSNACVLHYTKNNAQIKPGACVLLDAGACVNHYCSDVTRVWPISGRFSAEQRAVYELVLAASQFCIASVKTGVSMQYLQKQSQEILVDGLCELGIVDQKASKEEISSAFYGHGVGHSIGLDVHDPSEKKEAFILDDSMVITIEPGLYLRDGPLLKDKRFCGIGIRIEDNILLQKGGYKNLTASVPVQIEEIEDLVSG